MPPRVEISERREKSKLKSFFFFSSSRLLTHNLFFFINYSHHHSIRFSAQMQWTLWTTTPAPPHPTPSQSPKPQPHPQPLPHPILNPEVAKQPLIFLFLFYFHFEVAQSFLQTLFVFETAPIISKPLHVQSESLQVPVINQAKGCCLAVITAHQQFCMLIIKHFSTYLKQQNANAKC